MAVAAIPIPETPEQTMDRVLQEHGVTRKWLWKQGHNRRASIVRARLCRALYARGDLSLSDVGVMLRMWNHTSIWYWVGGKGKERYR